MKYSKIISKISSLQWAMEPNAFDGVLSFADGTITEDDYKLFHTMEKDRLEANLSFMGSRVRGTRYTYIDGENAYLFIDGPITPRATMFSEISGLVSIDSLSAEFKALAENPQVKNIFGVCDSPGGAITGVSEFAQMVRACDKSRAAYVLGMSASAMYWIGAAFPKMYSVDTGLIGSIGVIMTTCAKDKTSGAVEIVSSQSPDKSLDVGVAEDRKKIQTLIDSLGNVFVETVAGYRGVPKEKVLSDFGQGGVMVASDALAAGMIDGITTLEKLASVAVSDSTESGGSINVQDTKTKIDTVNSDGDNVENPAMDAGQIEERKTMETLTELLAKNPGAKAEYDAAISAAEKNGADAVTAEQKTRADAATPFLDHESKAVSGMAAKVMAGKAPVEYLEMAAANFDQIKESLKSQTAQDETDESGPTPAQPNGGDTNGTVKMTNDINVIRNLNGSKSVGTGE